MWSVLTDPCLVITVEPSTMGSRSRWTPSRDTSGPDPPPACWRPATLSISSMNTMPACSTRESASALAASPSISFWASSWASSSSASGTLTRRFLRFLPIPPSISCRLMPISSIPIGPNICRLVVRSMVTSTSTSRSSSVPARRRSRNFSRVRWRRSSSSVDTSGSAVAARRPRRAGSRGRPGGASTAAAAGPAGAPRPAPGPAPGRARPGPRGPARPPGRPGRGSSTRRRGRRSRPR